MSPISDNPGKLRIGAVSYLNTKPLVHGLSRLAPDAEIVFDLPSRLADDLAENRLDVALIPSAELLQHPEYSVVSDACIACRGPVLSVKLLSRVPFDQIQSVALDEGSRTSAALVRILLAERFGLHPRLEALPIGAKLDKLQADAAMLIGDRGMLPIGDGFEYEWDLGEQWSQLTGLPLVFAMWAARPKVDLAAAERVLTEARDEGVERLAEIARHESPGLGIPESECLRYLRDNLQFQLGPRQLAGLKRFYELATQHDLAPAVE
jgi:chorismate dehydratase